MRRKLTLAAIVSAFVLGACGVKGNLKTPPPIWGEKSKQEPADKPQDQTPPEETSDSDN